MKQNEKQQTAAALEAYVGRYKSQNKAAQSLGVAAATVSAILNGKHDLISDEMWRNIADKVGSVKQNTGWQIVETTAAQEMTFAMSDAHEHKNVTWVVGEAGCGKTTMARVYAQEHSEVFYVLCSEDMHKSDFIRDVARCIGLKTEGMTLREMLNGLTAQLVQMEQPLLIFDEADKLIESVFHYFIDLYNRLEDRCGIVFFSTSYIKRRMAMGLRYDKKGYNEIHSRIGRKFFELEATTAKDVYQVCMANGLTDKTAISAVVRDAEEYDFDLRRVKKAVHKQKLTTV